MKLNKFMAKLKEFQKFNTDYNVKAHLAKTLKSELKTEIGKQKVIGTGIISKILNDYVIGRREALARGRLGLAEFEAVQALKSKNPERSILDIKREIKSVLKPLNKKFSRAYHKNNNPTPAYNNLTAEAIQNAKLYFLNYNHAEQVVSKVIYCLGKYKTINQNLIAEVEKLIGQVDPLKHAKAIAEREGQLLKAALDAYEAKKNLCVGFLWITMGDDRVVGNPAGKYPNVYDETAHGNHWERHEKVVLYNKEDYDFVAKECGTAGLVHISKIKDGFPSKPYGCRCVAIQIDTLQEVISYLKQK